MEPALVQLLILVGEDTDRGEYKKLPGQPGQFNEYTPQT